MYCSIRPFASFSVFALLVVSGSWSFAYEPFLQDGYGEVRLGDPINQAGTRRTASSPAIDYRVNLLQCDDVDLNGVTDSSTVLADSDRSRFAGLVDSACRYWESVPSSFITLRLAGTDQTSTYRNLRSYLLMTLGRTPSGIAGASWGGSSAGQYYPMGIIINIEYFRRVSDGVIIMTIVHEIGHSLGLAHSSCDRYLTYNTRFFYTDSDGAFMSYGDRDGRTVLHSDDVSGISHVFPGLSFGTDFGSVSGELVDASGAAIFGGNVFAVNSANRAVAARISGLPFFTSLSTRGGRFKVEGLAPGTYTIVAASVRDATYRIGSLPALPFSYYYRTDFSAAVRTQVVIRGGEDTILGRVQAGSDQTNPGSGTLYTWNAVTGANYYLAYVYSYAQARWIVYGQRTDTNSIRLELAEGRYYLYVYANVNGTWVYAASRVIRAGDRPPVISAPSYVEATAGQVVAISFSASDPLGGPIRLSAEGMPSGMQLRWNQLYWSSAASGDYSIRIIATNEVGQSSSATVRLLVKPASDLALTFQWTRLEGDSYYYFGLYSYERQSWLSWGLVSTNSASATVKPGWHYAVAYRRVMRSYVYNGVTYNYYSWQWIGYAFWNAQASATIKIGS